MKFLTKILANPIVKTVGRLADSAILGGAIKNFKDESADSPKGKMDLAALVGSLVIPAVLIYLFATGKISMDEAEQLNEFAK